MAPLELSDVYRALIALVEPGATVEAIGLSTLLELLELPLATATDEGRIEATRDEVAAAVRRFLQTVADDIQSDPSLPGAGQGVAAQYLLALVRGTEGWPPEARKDRAAQELGIQRGTLTQRRPGKKTHLERLVDLLGQAVFAAETEYRLRQRAQRLAERRRPAESALGINWLARFERYYSVWTTVFALKGDLEIAVGRLHAADEPEFELYSQQSLYWYARFRAAMDSFERDFGGLWLTPDAEVEDRIADAIYRIGRASPCREIDDSYLRTLMRRDRELDTFVANTSDRLSEIQEHWGGWIRACRCRSDDADQVDVISEDCRLHRVISACRTYISAVDDQWGALADWYEAHRPRTAVDVAAFYAQQGRPD
jgi:hypothetical protein